MLASRYGHTNIIQLLLEHGADINLQDQVSSSAKIVCECLPYCCAPGMQYNKNSTDVNSNVCLPEYECLALSKLAPRPCYMFHCVEDDYLEARYVYSHSGT